MATVVHDRRDMSVSTSGRVDAGPARFSRLYRIGGIAAAVAAVLTPL